MKNKLIKFILMVVCVIALLPHSVHAEGGSSPILPVASHGNVIKKMDLSDFSDGTSTDATLEIYEDGYTVVKSNSTVPQAQKINNTWVVNAINNYYENPTIDITSLVYDSDTRLLVNSMNVYGSGMLSNVGQFRTQRRYNSEIHDFELVGTKLKLIDLSKTTPINDDGLDEMTDSTPESKHLQFFNTFENLSVDKLVFGENWSKVRISSMSSVFAYAKIKEVVGFEKLKIQTANMNSAFSNSDISSIDITKIDLTQLVTADRAFVSTSVPVGDLFSRQHITKLKGASYMFSLYKTDKPLDVTGIDLSEGGNFNGMFEALQAPSFKFEFSNAKGSFAYAFSRLGMQIDTSKLPKPIYKPAGYDPSGSADNSFYEDMLSYNNSWWEVYQKSLDLSDYSTDNIGSSNILDNQSGVQVIKTSTRTKLHPQYGNGLGIGSYSIFDKFIGFKQVYTGRWLLKYYADGSVVPEADRKYASTYADFNGIDGYWVREPVAGDNSPTLSGGRIYETEDDKWVTNADGSMTYNMKVFDRKDTHYIVEDENPNFIRTDNTTTVNGKQASTAVVGKDETTATVVNKYINSTNTEVRNLTIRKNVDVEDSTQFIFDVTLKHSTLSGIKKINDILFKDGVGTITLMGNKSITLELPKGTEYTITERAVKNWTLTSQENTTGTLDLNTEAIFTNTKDTVPNMSDSVTELNIEKNIPEGYTGNNADGQFTITVTLSGLEPNKTYQYEQYGSPTDFSSDENGLATLKLYMSRTAPVKIIANGLSQFKYSIKEDANDESDGFMFTTSMQVYEDNALIDNVGGKKGVDFTSKMYTAKTGKVNRAVVTNDIHDMYQLNVSKSVEGSDTTEPFDFTISVKGLKEGDSVYYMPYGANEATEVKYQGEYTEFNVKLANYGYVDVANIPMYAQVSVIEHANTRGFVSNYQDMSGFMTDNTTVGKEMATPYISGTANNSYVAYTFYNKKVQTITLGKLVTGTQGNKNELFNFKTKLIAEDGNTYTGEVILSRKNGQKEKLLPNAEGEYKYQMQHGDIIQLSGFDTKINTIEVTEEDNIYDTSVQVLDGEKNTGKSITVNVEDSDKYIQFTNNLGFTVPTGISLPFGGLLVLVGLGVIYIVKKGKREK